MKKLFNSIGMYSIVLSFFFISACNQKSETSSGQMPYKNASLPVEERVQDLLDRMTLEEKVMQLQCIWQGKTKLNEADGTFNPDKAKEFLSQGIGQIGRPSDLEGGGGINRGARSQAEYTNALQKYVIENTRLGIPVIFHEEALHGHAAKDATSFSQPIGLASTWDPELVERLYTMTAEEARLRGTHQALTPVVDVAREPRWGRVEETYGEDPYLVAQMGLAAVKGFQGPDPNKIGKKHVISTLKHFAAHGQPESGTNIAPVNISERTLRETFLYPFRVSVQKGGVKSIMASYNEIDGVPAHANTWLIEDVLRKEWGFTGTVVSDYYAVRELHDRHAVAKDHKEAAKMALMTGVDYELPDPETYPFLVEQAKSDPALQKKIDESVARILRHKFELGLFEDPYVNPDEAEKVVGSEENKKLALEAARKTIVLLKNDNNSVPLDIQKIKKIAVIGPNADRELLGGYSDVPKHFVTVLEGIKAKVGDKAEVLYAEGCRLTEDSVMQGGKKIKASWYKDSVVLVSPEENKRRISEAIKVAKKSDVIVLAIGGNELTSREGWAENHLGDRSTLELVGEQNDLVKAMLATGKPVVVFLFNGAPLAINHVHENVPAIFECWYLGQETGHAVADVLFGEYNPGGKLAITFPRSVGQIPVYYNYKPTARRGYLFDEISPLYHFGYGLSYTSFEMKNLRLLKSQMSLSDTATVMVDVTNTGSRRGDEVIQLYIRDKVSSATRPVKELKGFERVSLKPGETKTVKLKLTPDHLAFYDINMKWVVEPGEFDIMVGNSSRKEDLQKVMLTVAEENK